MREERVCVHHGLTEFKTVGSAKHWRCIRCRSEAVAKRRLKVKRILVEEAGGQCTRCGYNRCVRALHFHHRDPATKEFGIATKGFTRSLDSLRKEVEKCILLCANCHSEIEDDVV